MELWQKQLSQSAVKVKDLPFIPESDEYREKLEQVRANYPIRINSYFLDQIKSPNDPLWRQVVPTLEELDDFIQEDLISDPLRIGNASSATRSKEEVDELQSAGTKSLRDA